MINLPYLCWASQLLRRKGSLVHFCAIEDAELVLDGANPSICLKGIICLVEQRWLGGQKTDIVSFCWWWRSLSTSAGIGLHQLPHQLSLLIAVGDKSRNSLSQRGRWLGQCFVILIIMVGSVVITHLQNNHPLVSHSAIRTNPSK